MKKPTYRTMIAHEFNDSIFMKVGCDCGDTHIDLNMELDDHIIWLTIWSDIDFCSYYGDPGWLKEKWIRIKRAFKMLVTGCTGEMSSETVFVGEEHIDGFIKGLEYGRDKLKESVKGD